MRRRRPVGKNIYTIEYLLDKQPKALSRDTRYPLLISYFRSSPVLMRIRFNKRCYSLLHNAVIKPEHLENFYKTYRLPKDSFFPLFFMIKRNYLNNKNIKKREKQLYIQNGMENLPPYVIQFLKLINEMEKSYNRADLLPVYSKNIIPKTKKQIDNYRGFEHLDWYRFFLKHFEMMQKYYDRLPPVKTDKLTACLILECVPDSYEQLPGHSLVKSRYRKLSKEYHPDAGGDPELFIALKKARDLLLLP